MGEVEKEMLKMNYVDSQECAEFYFKHEVLNKSLRELFQNFIHCIKIYNNTDTEE